MLESFVRTEKMSSVKTASTTFSLPTDEFEAEAKKQFDIWSLIKRANTADPYVMMAKHRMNKSSRRPKTTGRLVRRRRISMAESLTEESLRSHTSTEIFDFEPYADDFDFDGDDDLHDTRSSAGENRDHCQKVYMRACNRFNVSPAANFYKALKTEKVNLSHRQLGAPGVKAICIALVHNSIVQTLDLSENDMGPRGAEYIADMLKENNFVVNLNLADNDLGVEGTKHIVDIVKQLDSVHSLSLAGNGIRECDSEVIRPLLEDTTKLKHLDLSHNQFREAGGEVLGYALANNDTMDSLDLSWNHLRRDGGVLVAEGLAENTCLKKLNLAWNGLYLDGCKAIARALEENTTLLELDLTCNRISKECLEKLMFGLRKNSTLEVLRLGWNPITPIGAMEILQFVNDNKNCAIKELDLTDQLVEPAFVALVLEMESKRNIKVVYGMVRGQDARGDDDDEKQLMDENPIIVLMEFGKLMGFRLMDLFAALDKDGSKSLDHNEIRTGLRMVNIPLSDKCIEILIQKLDVDGDGEIDFGELMAAQTHHRRKMSKFYAAQEGDIDVEDTEIGRVRIKLTRLMAKKMSGNPAFKHQSRMLLQQMGILDEDTDQSAKTKLNEVKEEMA